MPKAKITSRDFVDDRQGKAFLDVVDDPEQRFDTVLECFCDAEWQWRMEDAEIHHDRAPLAGVVRELESHPKVEAVLSGVHACRTQRLRQAIGVVIRIVMERRGWKKAGRKGSLGVRAQRTKGEPAHNTGGLAFWFVRAERYELAEGMPFASVSELCKQMEAAPQPRSSKNRQTIKE
ncbi:hypothetical protein KOR34_37100 [Posidoniimonas corsicana]|uniref:Uncharacterized protein n=1 Tax=Posidoniimonas corsicana TaxID=1938618 RepID=A0A5C5V5P1_9BACT|nr:hypothetical protein [Posidoniimonas corsicana]TWT33874.1 hypothetical protein KOR34_37100 [Posidoniimonas corsicana]